MSAPMLCLPCRSAYGIHVRVQPEVGAPVDVSALDDITVRAVCALAAAREPMMLLEAGNDCPLDRYALCERFCQLYEAARGEPFRLAGGKP